MLRKAKRILATFTDINDLMLSIHLPELLTCALVCRFMVKIIKAGGGFVGLTLRLRGRKLKTMRSRKYGSKKE